MYGWRADEVFGRRVSEVIRAALSESDREQVRQMLTQVDRLDIAGKSYHKDGSPIYVEITIMAVRAEDGACLGYAFSLHDITGHKQMEDERNGLVTRIEQQHAEMERQHERLAQALEAANRVSGQLTDLLESTHDNFFALDREWRFVYANRRYAESIGRNALDLIGKNFWEELPRFVGTHFEACYRRVMEERIPFHFQAAGLYTPNWYDISVYPTRDGISIFSINRTEERRTELALVESQERFLASVESLLDGFAILSAVREDGKIVDFQYEYINEAGCRLNHRSYEEQVGHRLLELLPRHRESSLFERYVRVVESGQPVVAEDEDYEDIFGDGKRMRRHFEVRAVKLSDGFVLTWRDISQRKQAEEQVRAYAEKLECSNRELEQFAFVASHDLQEPLRKIDLFAANLRQVLSEPLPQEADEYLRRMQSAARRMNEMIKSLLELSRVNTKGSQFASTDLNQVLSDVISDLEARLRSTQGKVVIESLPTIEVDAQQIRELFLNLIGNALKFHRPGVHPVVRVSVLNPHEDWMTSRKAQHISMMVEDNGIGFDQERAEQIFQPFRRLHGMREYEGTGMGLAICRKIVERHSGKIEAYGTDGQGARFVVTLPVKQKDVNIPGG